MAYQPEALAKNRTWNSGDKVATCPYCNGSRDPTPRFAKPSPWEFWDKIGRPVNTVAPMVDQSELPFRMLTRKYGADLAYTPMFHSRLFAEDHKYRAHNFTTTAKDRPLFVQFCGNDADVVLAAARFVEDDCDAVDLNLGCPQGIARRGFYGSFLMEHWDVVHTIVHTLHVELKIPVVVKMRIYDDLELTLKYATMLREAGAHLIAVHGRTRIMKGAETGLADLDVIAKVKEHITSVPIIANGNIQQYSDIAPNLAKTKCDGVMSAEGLLWDPKLFANPVTPVLTGRTYTVSRAERLAGIATAEEYLDFVEKYPVDNSMAKAHLFKMLYHSLVVHPAMRNDLGDIQCTLENLVAFVAELRVLEEEAAANEEDHAPFLKRSKTDESEAGAGGEACCGDGAQTEEVEECSLFD